VRRKVFYIIHPLTPPFPKEGEFLPLKREVRRDYSSSIPNNPHNSPDALTHIPFFAYG